jgi:acetylornithine deacetylase/succinyl-diaminopimelate desuccinylase-like protein
MPNTKKVQILKTLSDLIAFKTVAGNSEEMTACLDYVGDLLSFYPFIEKRYEFEGNPARVWLTQDTLTPEVMLYVHLDVVPGSEKMFKMKTQKGKAYGRGVADMKDAMAIYEYVLRKLLKSGQELPYSLGIMCVTDEERGGLQGVKRLVDEVGYRPEVVIMPDGGPGFHLVEEAKGASWVEITAKGKSAHASQLWNGDNAIASLLDVLSSLKENYPVPHQESWETTINLGTITGGTANNQVPDRAVAVIDVRHVHKHPIEKVTELISSKYPDIEVNKIIDKSAFHLNKKDRYVDSWISATKAILGESTPQPIWMQENGSADHHYFTNHNICVLVSEPIIHGIHTENEWIDIESMKQYADILLNFLQNLAREGKASQDL